jgi:1-phosphatidylinositol-3-phosphate 5-kinase
MAPSGVHEKASPSASSIFLPLGRRGRGDSRSSLSNPVDQDALQQALNVIHTAASQSQDLTVFNEYTDPPPLAADHDSKGIASEIQGSLSGLYNKLIGSVAVPKDVIEARNMEVVKPGQQSDANSKPGSCSPSRVQSPQLKAFDLGQTVSVPLKSPQISIKANVASSKSSGGTTPALKSPVAGVHKVSGLAAEPVVSESNVNATSNSTLHSRNTSQNDEVVQSTKMTVEGESLRRVLSKSSHSDESGTASLERRLISPNVTPLSPVEKNQLTARKMHERGISNGSIPDPARFLRDTGTPLSRSSTKISSPRPLSPRDSGPEQAKDTNIRPSQPRLPGYDLTRTSSTDSSLTAAQSPRPAPTQLDGTAKETSAPTQPAKVSFTLPRSKLLSKEYWMRDENARDCFHCGEPFSTFRRKHHCRTCGQIFDHKCTSTVPGAHFGSVNPVRVCKPCEAIISSRDDDSSDYSIEEIALPEPVNRPHTPLDQKPARDSPRFDDDNASVFSQSLEQMARTPTMSFPVRRALDSNNRNSAILEFDSNRSLPRPSSSRSLRTAHSINHPHIYGHGHKRHNSRHQHVRNYKAYHEERAPFQKRLPEETLREGKQSAFHKDSIIDPDLAQYLSDDASSDEEQSVDVNYEESQLSRSGPESDKVSIGGLLAAVRKGRSRFAEKSIASLLAGKDADEVSITSTRAGGQLRSSRKRNLSVASSVHQKLIPKQNKDALYVPSPNNREALRSSSPSQMIPIGSSRMMRSASMRGSTAPSMELNTASIQHVRKLLQQLLRDSEVPRQSSWEVALLPILLRATDDVDPDVQNGDDMDMRHYVKLKKILGGKPGDTAYIPGLVFTKNLALKSMPRSIPNPRILIITFSLEYARYEQHFMSLDPVIRQEREYLENLVGRIAALQPDLLLAQRNVSGLALELLDKANVATAYNVKATNLEAISRFTQSRIIYSVDQLTAPHGTLGTCENFEVKTYVAEGKKKTYMYLSGCPPSLGCTVTIRGADRGTLEKVKKITEFMVYVVYNLKLETCLMRDEWALISSQPNDSAEIPSGQVSSVDKSAITATTSESRPKPDNVESQSAQPHDAETASVDENQLQGTQPEPATRVGTTDSADIIPDDIPVPTLYEDLVEKHQSKILSASPFVKFAQPYLLTRARELERRVAYLKRLRDQDASELESSEEKAKANKFTLIQPEMIHNSLVGASKKVREVLHALHDTEYEKALHNYDSQKKQWEAHLSANRNLFDPFAHQNIAVLYSVVSTESSIPCHGPDVIAFAFYHEHDGDDTFEADSTIGQVVESLCHTADDMCPWDACEKKLYEHHRQYVHGEAQVSVFVQPYPSKMRGMQNTILMWSQCKKCGVETPVIPMSASTWKYSFGKYLELSFWSADLHARAGICPHDLHRDHLRYFGYKDFALRIHYDPIELLDIIVPRLRITWKVENDLKFRNKTYTRIEQRLTRFMVSVKLRLKSINAEALLPENAEACGAEIEKMTKRANDEHAMLVKQLQECYMSSRHWETTPLNRVVRMTIEKQTEWENTFLEFEKNFFPSEKDIRRLATLQLKKIFLDSEVSVTSIASAEDESSTPPSEDAVDEKALMSDPESHDSKSRKTPQLSPEKTESVLQSVVEEHMSPTGPSDSTQSDLARKPSLAPLELSEVPRITNDVRHLDLAVSDTLENHARPEGVLTPLPPAVGRKPSAEEVDHPSDGHLPQIVLQTEDETPSSDQSRAKAIDLPRPSGLPRAVDSNTRLDPMNKSASPALLRSQSQPAGSANFRREKSSTSTLHTINATNGFGSGVAKSGELQSVITESVSKPGEKKLSERFGLLHLKGTKFPKGQSLIPRSVAGRKDSRVSNLAKHFEQLSREFEKERVRERKLRASKNRHSRAYPLVTSKPIVEVYKSVDEAVEEKDPSYSDLAKEVTAQMIGETADTAPGMAHTDPSLTAGEGFHGEETPAEGTETEGDLQETSRAASDVDLDDNQSDSDDLGEDIQLPDTPEDLLRLSQEELDLKELPKHERTSLMKMLQNFWAERSSSGWTPLEYPLSATDHVFADCDIIVREDEPSSIIAFALSSDDYKSMLFDIRDCHGEKHDQDTADGVQSAEAQADVMHSLLRKTGTHLKYQFQQGPAKMTCKIFFAEQFDAVRRKCGIADRIIESLSRCMKWDSKGGKTKSLFLKTSDDRFVLKSLSQIETQSFLKFAPNYFQIMSEAFFHELPSVIAKMLGFYQIIVKNPVTGIEYTWNLLLMENLFYDRSPTRIFDLKGSMRNRKIQSTGERNEVLLDENMVEFIYESPLFAREHSKKVLRSSVHNDTLFLARQNVMDYSLMVAIDENRKELVVGIIDCIRTYTWDKKLESWIKDRGFAGGNKNRPTVTSPKEYKKRFREAMMRYVLEAPNCWYQCKPGQVERRLTVRMGQGQEEEGGFQVIS